MNEKIFIPISACNEKDILQTVLSAINNAQYPDRLFFTIIEQSLNNTYTDFSTIKKNLIHIKIDYKAPLGTGFARMCASMINNKDENFVFQIDAHMIFEKNWDVDLINYYSIISKKYNKPIISSYTPWWYENRNKEIKLSVDDSYVVDTNNFYGVDNLFMTKMVVEDFSLNLNKKYPSLTGKGIDWSNNKQYEEHFGIGGAFVFTNFSFIEEIAHDPSIHWMGDEILIALRSWTRGYNIFCIPKSIAWHKNKWIPNINNTGFELIDKNDWRTSAKYNNQTMFNLHSNSTKYSYKKIKNILLGDYLGFWGAPNKELLQEFEKAIGKQFKEYYDLLKDDLINNKDFEMLKVMYE